jgi:hypothetical protein
LFFASLPLVLALVWMKAGWQLFLIYVAVISVGASAVAARGLTTARRSFFPRNHIYAPLWIASDASAHTGLFTGILRAAATRSAIKFCRRERGEPGSERLNLPQKTSDEQTI